MSLIKSCLADLRMAITFQPTRCSRTKEPQPQLSKRGRLLHVFQATRNTNSSTHCVIKTKTLTLLCTEVIPHLNWIDAVTNVKCIVYVVSVRYKKNKQKTLSLKQSNNPLHQSMR